uniref:Dolichyldiphosphatase 1 n=1 Tax=Anthurium amnicola TaxID=1678845 RepID=A0A1D1ZID0_9ARAE
MTSTILPSSSRASFLTQSRDPSAMAAPQAPPSARFKSLRPSSVSVLSGSKKAALDGGGSGSWRSVSRNPVVLRVGMPGPSQMTEMVRAPPDGLPGSPSGGGEEGGGETGGDQTVVLTSGSNLTPDRLESTLNRLSKWVVAAVFGLVILWKHDAEAMWAAMGAVLNAWLSAKLKQILNHERPDPALRSDPGMPSSHAQSIFYAAFFVVISLVDSLGINLLTLSVGTLTLACSSYLAWLRVSQKLHTVSQIGVGAALGSTFSITWFWLWHTFVFKAFVSSILVRIVVILGSAAFCLVFLVHVVQHWLLEDEGSL